MLLLGDEQRRWRMLDLETELGITASALLVNVRVLLAGKITLLFQDGSPSTAIFYWVLGSINPLFSGVQWWMVVCVSPASLMKPGEEDTGLYHTQCSVHCEPLSPHEQSHGGGTGHSPVLTRLGKLFLLYAYPLQSHPHFSFDISFFEKSVSITFLSCLWRLKCSLFTGQEENSWGKRERQVREGKCSL